MDLNADLGEHESPALTAALLQFITSANIACGGHAGTAETMERCLRLAVQFGVRVGAHPGLPGNFGRAQSELTPAQLTTLLSAQVLPFAALTERATVNLHHVKLHGALYHATEHDPSLAEIYVQWMASYLPNSIIYARAGGFVQATAQQLPHPVWAEAFSDRGYEDDGNLIPRGKPGAMLENLAAAVERLRELKAGRGVIARSGKRLALHADTVCVHADSTRALEWAQALRRELDRARLSES